MSSQTKPGKISVAPMMDWTDRHCRYFHRLLAPSAHLYTEMVTTGAILHGDRERLLNFNQTEHPVALQLGGSEPSDLAECARIGAEWGYDEINLNVGCPSDRVQKGRFGACLMKEPELVRDCIAAMRDAVDVPVTVKTRLGVDDLYSYEYFLGFIDTVAESGCHQFVVHARKAWLSGLSPKENRDVPELRPDWVMQLRQERPDLELVINGGVRDVESVKGYLEKLDGVMLGRAAYQNPWILAECEASVYGTPLPDRETVIHKLTDYIRVKTAQGVFVKHISRHVLGLFQGLPGARVWRRYISENAHLDGSNSELLLEALERMPKTGRFVPSPVQDTVKA
ncbi:MAG TPA: tRNA dihydrouridine(20/20a) synthase DusA [Xanthomonadales bacterium]|nr:tRNA dihydrouridine(20/20a) synthase DusA [Xanthomonadales bacterium]